MQWLWNIIAIPFGYLMQWMYALVNDILHLPLAYVWAMFLFALVTRLLQLPLTIQQQRSMGKTAALNVLMEKVRKTYAKDQKKQQEEMQRIQQDLGISPLSGCLPMLIQFPILFGLVEVIYKPLTYMLRIPAELLDQMTIITKQLTGVAEATAASRTFQNEIIAQVKTNFDAFTKLVPGNETYFQRIQDLQLSIGSMNLWETPKISEPSWIWILPVFSIVTMLLSSFISMRTGEQQSGNTGKVMMIAMAVMFGFISFTFPAGFSLYWGLTNLIMIGQTFLMRKVVNTKAIKEKVLADYEAKNAARKTTKKKVQLIDEKSGNIVEKEMSATELAKLRLQRARELDAARYSDDEDDVAPAPVKTTEYIPEATGDDKKKKKN